METHRKLGISQIYSMLQNVKEEYDQTKDADSLALKLYDLDQSFCGISGSATSLPEYDKAVELYNNLANMNAINPKLKELGARTAITKDSAYLLDKKIFHHIKH